MADVVSTPDAAVTAGDARSEAVAESKANTTEPAQSGATTSAAAAEGERERERERATVEGEGTDANATAPIVMEKEKEVVLRPPPPIDPIAPEVARLHLAIAHAFKVFDHEGNNTVDVRELGTVVRSLGCCPSEAELHQIILEVRARMGEWTGPTGGANLWAARKIDM